MVSDDDANQLAALPFGMGWGDVAQDDELAQTAMQQQMHAARQAQGWLETAAQYHIVLRLEHLQRVFGLNSFVTGYTAVVHGPCTRFAL